MSASFGIRQSAWSTFHDAQGRAARQDGRIGVQDNPVRGLECAERVALRLVGVVEQAQGVVGMCREHDGVESVKRSGRRADGDTARPPDDVHDRIPARTASGPSRSRMRSTYVIEPPRIVRHWSERPMPIRP